MHHLIDVDECRSHDYGCSQLKNERCMNIPGSYICRCMEGYENSTGTCIGKLIVMKPHQTLTWLFVAAYVIILWYVILYRYRWVCNQPA